jgi:DNA-binding Lrp family transcriptional regulator
MFTNKQLVPFLNEGLSMMTILMIDVEGGKEDLLNRLHKRLMKIKKSPKHKNIQILYLSRCYTHSDISFMVDAKDPEALPTFVTDVLLDLDGVWDIQMIPLLNPNFFEIPKYIRKSKYQHFTISLDVKSNKTKSVFNYLKKIAATKEIAITFLAYSFSSYESDILITLLSPDISAAGNFVKNNLRTIDGVIDSLLWQIETYKSLITDDEWKEYVTHYLKKDILDAALEKWEMDGFICGC